MPEKNGRNASAWRLSASSALSGNSNQSAKLSFFDGEKVKAENYAAISGR